jgi:hypothetical protein
MASILNGPLVKVNPKVGVQRHGSDDAVAAGF